MSHMPSDCLTTFSFWFRFCVCLYKTNVLNFYGCCCCYFVSIDAWNQSISWHLSVFEWQHQPTVLPLGKYEWPTIFKIRVKLSVFVAKTDRRQKIDHLSLYETHDQYVILIFLIFFSPFGIDWKGNISVQSDMIFSSDKSLIRVEEEFIELRLYKMKISVQYFWWV